MKQDRPWSGLGFPPLPRLVRRVTILVCARVTSAWLLVLGGIVLGLVAYDVQIDNLGAGTTTNRAAAGVVAAWAFLAAGIAVWSRRPGNWLGPLMVATCFALLARQLRYSHDALAFTIFFALGELGFALIAHSALAYPSGRVTDRSERRFLAAAYAAVLAFPLAILLVHDEGVRLRYFDAYPRRSLLRISGQDGLAGFLEDSYAVLAYGALAAIFVVLVARRLRRATPRGRWVLAPVLVGVVVAALWAVYNSVVAFSTRPPAFVAHNVFWWQIAGLIALPRRALLRSDPVPPRPRGRRRPRPAARADAAGRDPRRARRGSARPHARGRVLAARTRRVRRRRGAARRRFLGTGTTVRSPTSSTTTSRSRH